MSLAVLRYVKALALLGLSLLATASADGKLPIGTSRRKTQRMLVEAPCWLPFVVWEAVAMHGLLHLHAGAPSHHDIPRLLRCSRRPGRRQPDARPSFHKASARP